MSGSVCDLCGKDLRLDKALSVHRSKCAGKLVSASKLRELAAANQAKRKRELKERETRRPDDDDQDFSLHQDDPIALFDAPLELPVGTKRQRRLPKRFVDHVPSTSSSAVLPTTSLPHLLDLAPPPPAVEPGNPEPVETLPDPSFTTPKTDFGVYRVYSSRPRDDPDEFLAIDDLCDSPDFAIPEREQQEPSLPQLVANKYYPFENAASFILANWQNNGITSKSDEQMNILAQEISSNPDFLLEDLRGYNAKRARSCLDSDQTNSLRLADAWREGSVKIKLPAEDKVRRPQGETTAPELEVHGIQYRPLLDTIYSALDDPRSPPLHFTPYKEYWQPDASRPPERIYGEMYSSDVWIEAHDEIQKLPKKDEIDNFVLPVILYSDSTHLANFGTASLWPLYMFLGSVSKYTRSKPTEAVCHHLAYIPSLPGNVQDVYHEHFGRTASSAALTHLKRELMQAVLSLVLLQDDVLDAYKNGIEFDCSDGVTRRLFPRFTAYSADYPERTLIATTRNLGSYPCPSCLTPLNEIHLLGTVADKKNRKRKREDDEVKQNKIAKARKHIFEEGLAVESSKVKNILSEGSLLPIKNSFSVLAPLGLNYYDFFVPDLMHEFELGVWKSIFTHLVRILYAEGGDVPAMLDARYRLVPKFGRGTIRRFPENTSAMQKLAARDLEDMLQCSIPVFDCLLPGKHDGIVSDLLYVLCTWHSLAKLRLHTDTSVKQLDDETTRVGRQVRRFYRTTCQEYTTRETTKEIASRGRREAARVAKGKPVTKAEIAKKKKLNLNTPKMHALGYYSAKIPRVGTTDSVSTQVGEKQHKRVKRLYAMTNKRNAARDVSKLEGHQRILKGISTKLGKDAEELPKTAPDVHYHMGKSRKNFVHIYSWIAENNGDPALTHFMGDFRSHILGRLLSRSERDGFSPDEIDRLHIKGDRLYRLKVLRINYTSYDLRRDSDSINSTSRPDIILLSGDSGDSGDSDSHPYTYARVIGVFHSDIAYATQGTPESDIKYERMDIIWARFFRLCPGYSFGFSERKLPRLEFLHHTEAGAFGFLDPEIIIRSVHLIPAFNYGKTSEFLPKSIVRPLPKKSSRGNGEDDEDYWYYYVNIFADRDLFMRHRGGGVGHKITWDVNQILLKQDAMDDQDDEEEDEEEDEDQVAEVENVEQDQQGSDGEKSADEETENESSNSSCGDSEGYADL